MLTKKQDVALNMMKQGLNVFITGEAGTGKSYVLKEFLQLPEIQNKNVLVTAPTGIASINVGGCTLHKAFKISTDIVKVLKGPRRVEEPIKKIDILIIDEISMCRVDVFDYVCKAIQMANKWRKKNCKPPIQLILVGDFYQLPPVMTDKDEEVLKYHYKVDYLDGAYAFQSDYWNKLEIHMIALNEVVRQEEPDFIEALNKIRVGDAKGIRYFNSLNNQRNEKGICLNAVNKKVDAVNNQKLDELNGRAYHFHASIRGDVREKDMPTSRVLFLKKNCRLILLNNDDNNGYVNGDLGTLVDIDTRNNKLHIKLDNNDRIIKVSPFTWKFTEPVLVDGKFQTKEVGAFIQFPVRLAYAITMHKSQGMTYETVNIAPFSFTSGQLYVALSRARNSKNLFLEYSIYPSHLITSKEVQKFYKNPMTYKFFGCQNDNVSDDAEDKEELKKEFEELWKKYPKKEGKQEALQIYILARTDEEYPLSFEECNQRIDEYVEYVSFRNFDKQYIKKGSSFFMQFLSDK